MSRDAQPRPLTAEEFLSSIRDLVKELRATRAELAGFREDLRKALGQVSLGSGVAGVLKGLFARSGGG